MSVSSIYYIGCINDYRIKHKALFPVLKSSGSDALTNFDGVDRFMYYVSSSHHHTNKVFALEFFSLPILIHRRHRLAGLDSQNTRLM